MSMTLCHKPMQDNAGLSELSKKHVNQYPMDKPRKYVLQ